MMIRTLKYCLVILIACACHKNSVTERLTIVNKGVLDFEEEDVYIRKNDGAVTGKYYVRIDSTNVYGKGYSYQLPDSLKKQNIRVSLSFCAKLEKKRFGQSVVVALQGRGQNYFWGAIDLGPLSYKKDKWFLVKDSIQFYFDPPDTNKCVIQVFGYDPYKFSALALDDLKIEIKKVEYLNN